MKKLFAAAVLLIFSLASRADDPGINEKVLDAFQKTFVNPSEVSWSETATRYEVCFKQEAVRVRVNYDKEGNIMYTLRYYGEEGLPLIILSKLKTRFQGKTIFGVTEMASEEGTYYHVILEGEKDWLQVKADGYGSISVEKKMKKG